MNIENLQNTYPKLLLYMKESKYSAQYTKRVENVILNILKTPQAFESYQDMYLNYEANRSYSASHQMMAAIGAVMRFDLFGEYPDAKHSSLIKNTAYTKLLPEFKQLIDYYINTESVSNRLKESTIKRNASCVSSFMVLLQNLNITSLSDVTEEAVLSAFVTEDGIPQRSATIAYCIKDVLGACMHIAHDSCKNVIGLIPKIKRVKKNYPYLTPSESLKIREALSEDSKLSLRDKAIGVLACYTGLRFCDISSLELNSIDWERDIIKVKQQKTDVPLELPLSATVGNAIYDYLTNERPNTSNNTLILTRGNHPRKIGKWSQKGISLNIMNQANVRQNPGDRRGIHIFRHRFTTSLLENGISQPIISNALGQLAPKSLQPYLSADIENLRKCALSIEPFSDTIKEVFGDE